jgi:hypothetical protein
MKTLHVRVGSRPHFLGKAEKPDNVGKVRHSARALDLQGPWSVTPQRTQYVEPLRLHSRQASHPAQR